MNKYLSKEERESEGMQNFLEAVNLSYLNYEDHIEMSQRAMKISSDELSEANAKLRKEGERQQKIIENLNRMISNLNLKSPGDNEKLLSVLEISDFIEKQSKEISRKNKQRAELLKSLEQKNQVLSDYAHMVSHDLKSPLRSIDSLINWIKEDNEELINEECSVKFGMILQNVEKMDSLISGILNYSTIDQAEFENYEVDLHHLVSEINQSHYIPSHIQISIKETLPALLGDKFRLQQLFQNIIQNAIKSIDKESGKIEIGVQENKKEWEFYIKDNGKGIPLKHHQKIFQIFEKIENDQTATGIGLSIVKKIVDFYNGTIWLTSEEGKGTTFYFTLPKK